MLIYCEVVGITLHKPSRGGHPTATILMKNNFDLRNHDNLIDEINAIVNSNEVAEVKAEYKQGKPSYKVVKINRKVVASSEYSGMEK